MVFRYKGTERYTEVQHFAHLLRKKVPINKRPINFGARSYYARRRLSLNFVFDPDTKEPVVGERSNRKCALAFLSFLFVWLYTCILFFYSGLLNYNDGADNSTFLINFTILYRDWGMFFFFFF